MKNDTNLTKYKVLAPIYDWVFNPFLKRARKKAFTLLKFNPQDDVLLVGVGTGLDLSFIPEDCSITGIDISEEMLKKARAKTGRRRVELFPMNAESLEFKDQTFDTVV
ncbi:MAG TPA: class I SAM-dependent methyltransferase, partial [Bacillota bacterium]|nr:class I SAM-dependent methyltransferase [Bacillota bacterium]